MWDGKFYENQPTLMRSRRWILIGGFASLIGCEFVSSRRYDEWVIGVISYEQDTSIVQRFANFNRYLAEKTGAHIELEPAFNETNALERIQHQSWKIVFAPPGVAAIAISRYQYLPLFALQGVTNQRSMLIVREDSPIRSLAQVAGQRVALGQPGSATGYYLPLYNLYGLTLAQVLFAPTPQTVLQWLAEGKVTVGALSLAEFEQLRQTNQTPLRVLFMDAHPVPPGAVLLSPTVDRTQQDRIREVMQQASSGLVEAVGYLPRDPVPDYQYMISVVDRVQPLAAHLQEQPARIF
ncbi:MAG: phosphonate ABC transporter substrate-binding protein [Leptolyngbya sp. ERB_1_1]